MRPVWQRGWDLLGAPLRLVLLPDGAARRLGLTSLEDERLAAVWPWLRGRVLDIGAGGNRLVRAWGHGIGVDPHGHGGAWRRADSARLPFRDGAFGTVTCLAALNHIPARAAVLREARRLLAPGGRVVCTMIGPWVGAVGHRLWWYGEDRHRHVDPGERPGLAPGEVLALLDGAGLRCVLHRRFVYGLNHLFVAEPHPPR